MSKVPALRRHKRGRCDIRAGGALTAGRSRSDPTPRDSDSCARNQAPSPQRRPPVAAAEPPWLEVESESLSAESGGPAGRHAPASGECSGGACRRNFVLECGVGVSVCFLCDREGSPVAAAPPSRLAVLMPTAPSVPQRTRPATLPAALTAAAAVRDLQAVAIAAAAAAAAAPAAAARRRTAQQSAVAAAATNAAAAAGLAGSSLGPRRAAAAACRPPGGPTRADCAPRSL